MPPIVPIASFGQRVSDDISNKPNAHPTWDGLSEEASHRLKAVLNDPDFWNDPTGANQAALMGEPPPPYLNIEEARNLARQRRENIFRDQAILVRILNGYEETIRKRWLKKTGKQRREILLKVWPNMAESHRPDFAALRKETARQRMQGTRFRDDFVWPYINLEDLSKGKVFLLLLDSRTRNPPHEFAFVDSFAARPGKVTYAVKAYFLNGCTMLLNGQTGDDYGRIVAWEEDDRSFLWFTNGAHSIPGDGLLVFEIQERILQFLVQCCFAILHDTPQNILMSEAQSETSVLNLENSKGSPLEECSEEIERPSLATIASEAAYRRPRHLDVVALQALVAAKPSEAEDHIWQLGEDPSYFEDNVRDESEHHEYRILDNDRKPHPEIDTPKFWDGILRGIIEDAYTDAELWKIAHQDVQVLKALEFKYRDTVLPTERLPKEYEMAFCDLKFHLEQMSERYLTKLKLALAASPPFRHLFTRANTSRQNISIAAKSSKLTSASLKSLAHIFQILMDERLTFNISLSNLLDEIQHLIEHEKEIHDLISARVARIIADLALVTEMTRQLQMYQPWFTMIERRGAADSDGENVFKVTFIEKMATVNHCMVVLQSPIYLKFGDPLDGRFSYPSHKRRTRDVTEKLCQAEKALDELWAKIGIGNINNRLLNTVGRTLQRTSGWKEPESKKPRKPSAAQIEISSQRRFDIPEQAPQVVSVPAKVKSKTRGTGPIALDNPGVEVVDQTDIQPTFHVSRNVLKVFRTLFFVPSQSETPGEVSWPDFLKAMKETGFTFQKLYGSVWKFSPQGLDIERNINFHEPHPQSKIVFSICRRYGRRLNRAYGWTGDMFVLKD